MLWEVSYGSESTELLYRQANNSNSGWESFWEWSPVGSWFSTSLFRDVSGAVPESVRNCRFKENWSNLDRAPKLWDSVLLKSWDSFLVIPWMSRKFAATCKLLLAEFGTVHYRLFITGPAEAVPIFAAIGYVSTEAEMSSVEKTKMSWHATFCAAIRSSARPSLVWEPLPKLEVAWAGVWRWQMNLGSKSFKFSSNVFTMPWETTMSIFLLPEMFSIQTSIWFFLIMRRFCHVTKASHD